LHLQASEIDAHGLSRLKFDVWRRHIRSFHCHKFAIDLLPERFRG